MSTTERKQQKTLRKLGEVSQDTPVGLVYRNGGMVMKYFWGITQTPTGLPALQYATRPSDPDAFYGSKVDPADWLPCVPLQELGFLALPDNKKISLVPFHYPR